MARSGKRLKTVKLERTAIGKPPGGSGFGKIIGLHNGYCLRRRLSLRESRQVQALRQEIYCEVIAVNYLDFASRNPVVSLDR